MAKKIRIIPELDESKLRQQLDKIEKQKEKITVDIDAGNIGNADQNIKRLNNTVSNSNTIFGKLKNTISNTFSTGKIAMTGYLMVLNEINKAGKNAKQTINELDKAVTDLSIATNMSRESVTGLIKDYNTYAKELKSTTTQITSAADDYLRAGKTMGEAQTLIKDSIMLSKLGQLESDTATEDLLAVMNGYEMSIDEVGKALDAMVAIDMKAATSAGDIATALKYCASSADVAGLSFDKLAAMIATTQEKTMQSAETIGTFMNTILSRYRNVKIGQFVSDDGEDLSEVETILNSLDIKLRDSSQEFRDFETVIEEVALSWDSYSSVQQAAIAKAFSGTRQQNRFLALMEGYNKTLELTEVAANSAGTAVEKFNNSYMDSLEAKQNALQASFESMIINTDFSEVYAGILDAATALVDFINQTNTLKGVMSGLAISGVIKGFLAIKSGISEAYISLNKFQNALDIVKKTNISTKEYERLLLLSNGLSSSQMKLVLSTNSLSVAQKKELLMASGLSEEEAILQLQTWKMTAANTGLTASTVSLGNAFKALWSTLIANPLIIVTALISGAVMAYQSYNQKLEETRQKNIESATTASENADKLKDLYNEYNRLASIQDRTTSEEEAFKTAVENITVALGDKAEILKDLTAGTDEYADALAKATKEELQSQAVTATIGRKSAEEELQSKTWSDWNGSKVSIDSNDKGKALSEEAQKAVDIVSESLKEYETINRTWKNISWDIDSDDPVEALEYYNSLIEAREKLVLASEDDEALLDTEIYEDLNTAINSMSESLDTYIEKLYEEQKLSYMAQNGIPSVTEEYKAMESALVSAAGSSVDLQNRFKELLTSDFSDLATDIENVGDAISDMTEQMGSVSPTFSLSETINQLNTQIKPAFDALKSAWQDIFTDDGFALNSIDIISTCDSIKAKLDEMSELGLDVDYSAYEHFIDILNSSDSTVNDVKESFNQLATSITQAGVSGAEDFETMKAALEDLGVINEELVVFDALISNTEALKEAGLDLASATDEQIAAFANEIVSTENVSQAIAMLTFQKELCGLQDMDTAGEVANLLTLAENAGYTGEVIEQLTELEQIYQQVASGTLTPGQLDAKLARAAELEASIKESANNIKYEPKVDFSGATKSAGKAGKEAGDQYLKAFQEEYSHLKDQLDRGEISETQYLNRLRSLCNRYFRDRKEYLDEFKKYENEYLSGMVDLHNKALSGISTLLNSKISAANDAKDASVSALQKEKEAAQDAYQVKIDAIEKEKDAIDDLIKEKNKKIDAINEEIEAIERTAETRKKNIDLQQQEFNLQKMLNNRTTAVYKQGEGFVFETDTSGIRDAREKVTEAKEALQIDSLKNEISLIQKEIGLLEEKKDALSEEQENIQKLMDESNKYYDNLIKQQEQYWDSMIKGMEQQKSRWEELAEVEEIAKAFSYIQQVFGELGYSVEDVLNGSDAAFEDFKAQYISLISDMNSNSDFTDGLVYSTGVAKENLGSFLDKTKETAEGLDELGEKGSEIDSVAEGMNKLSDSATSASTNTEGISDNLTSINDALTGLPETDKLDDFATKFTNLGEAIQAVADVLGIGEEGAVSTLVTALQDISTLSLNDSSVENGSGGGIISQFNNLKTAVDDVTSAISGGSSSENSTDGDASTSSSPSMGTGAGGEDANGLVGAIEDIKSTADEALGGGEGSENGGNGAIPQFQELKTAVDDVIAAIGIGESENSEGSENTLIGALRTQYETASETLPETKALFEELLESIMSCVGALNSMVSLMGSMSEIGGLGSHGISVTPHAKGTVGNAYAKGTGKYKGLPKAEKNALVSEYGQTEMTVLPNGKTILTDKPTLMDLPKDTVIFNEKQTKKIMDNKVDASGTSYANGTVIKQANSKKSIIANDIFPEMDLWQRMEKCAEAMGRTMEDMLNPLNSIAFDIRKETGMGRLLESVNNVNNVMNNNNKPSISIGDINVTCPGVTSQEVMREVGDALGKQIGHLAQRAIQEQPRRY